MKQTFSYAQRLHQCDDFDSVLKKKALTEKWLAIHSVVNVQGADRLGIVVSKRIVPKAVARNRIKRLIREVFRTSEKSISRSSDVVVRLRKAVLANETTEFKQTMSRLLKKVRMTENDAPVFITHKGLPISD